MQYSYQICENMDMQTSCMHGYVNGLYLRLGLRSAPFLIGAYSFPMVYNGGILANVA